MEEFDEPREIEIEFTYERARAESSEDEDSLDEDAISDIDFLIGESRQTIEMGSWAEMPKGYEPVNQNEAEEYERYLQKNSYLFDDEDEDIDNYNDDEEEDIDDEDIEGYSDGVDGEEDDDIDDEEYDDNE
jgi:hypothetical protein